MAAARRARPAVRTGNEILKPEAPTSMETPQVLVKFVSATYLSAEMKDCQSSGFGFQGDARSEPSLLGPSFNLRELPSWLGVSVGPRAVRYIKEGSALELRPSPGGVLEDLNFSVGPVLGSKLRWPSCGQDCARMPT
jgi:hypothetical protein